MSSDVKAKRVTGTGSLAVGPARIRQIHVLSGSGTPRINYLRRQRGATVLDLDLKASDVHAVNIPDDGIRVSDIHVATATALTAITVFFN